MDEAISGHREEISEFAPRILHDESYQDKIVSILVKVAQLSATY